MDGKRKRLLTAAAMARLGKALEEEERAFAFGLEHGDVQSNGQPVLDDRAFEANGYLSTRELKVVRLLVVPCGQIGLLPGLRPGRLSFALVAKSPVTSA